MEDAILNVRFQVPSSEVQAGSSGPLTLKAEFISVPQELITLRNEVEADRAEVASNKAATDTNVTLAQASEDAAAASEVNTANDAAVTAADRVATGEDATATAADRVATGLDADATADDRVQTGMDATATAADRVQTGLDVTDAGNSASAASASEASAANDAAATAADRVATGNDADATAADRVATAADRVATNQDTLDTAADRVATGDDASATAADRVQTGLDVTTTGANVSAAALSETNAADSESSAATSEGNALTYRNKAEEWAEHPEDSEVEPGSFSSMHWAKKAEASAAGGMSYRGGWDASVGTFPDGAQQGWLYKVTVAGTVDGQVHKVGDSIIYNGGDDNAATGWDHVDNTESVTSVAGRVGDVTVNQGDVGLGSVRDVVSYSQSEADALFNDKLDATANAVSASKWQTGRTISLGGDLSGTSPVFDGSGDITIVATVADDSHNHVIGNVDGLQTALDGKLDNGAKAADSDLLDGQDSSAFEAAGTAASEVVAHEGKADPHSQYTTDAEARAIAKTEARKIAIALG